MRQRVLGTRLWYVSARLSCDDGLATELASKATVQAAGRGERSGPGGLLNWHIVCEMVETARQQWNMLVVTCRIQKPLSCLS